MNFVDALHYLEGTINETISRREPYRLDRMRALLRQLGDPQNAYPTVHVGGTSGKGSTSTMLAAILQAAGKRVGLHTKPHVRSITERARIDGIPIPDERFAEMLSSMMPAVEAVTAKEGRPSYYETVLALAFIYFALERVDIAVIEVGIGGKLDGTNVIVPQVSVITTVGYDHTEILGNTLEEIAADKAGIAKPGVPLVSAVADAGARRVIEGHCKDVGAPCISVLDTVNITVLPNPSDTRTVQRFTVKTPLHTYRIRLPLLGAFQRLNAATAIRAIETMAPPILPMIVERGLARISLTGRMEYFPGQPGIVFDIAHNPEKATNLVQSIEEHFPQHGCIFVVAIGETKDAREILRSIVKRSHREHIFTAFHARGKGATDPELLARIVQEMGHTSRVIPEPVTALREAIHMAGPHDLVIVTGSTFIVAELREWWSAAYA